METLMNILSAHMFSTRHLNIGSLLKLRLVSQDFKFTIDQMEVVKAYLKLWQYVSNESYRGDKTFTFMAINAMIYNSPGRLRVEGSDQIVKWLDRPLMIHINRADILAIAFRVGDFVIFQQVIHSTATSGVIHDIKSFYYTARDHTHVGLKMLEIASISHAIQIPGPTSKLIVYSELPFATATQISRLFIEHGLFVTPLGPYDVRVAINTGLYNLRNKVRIYPKFDTVHTTNTRPRWTDISIIDEMVGLLTHSRNVLNCNYDRK